MAMRTVISLISSSKAPTNDNECSEEQGEIGRCSSSRMHSLSASVSESDHASDAESSKSCAPEWWLWLLPPPNTLPSLAPSPDSCLVNDGEGGDFDDERAIVFSVWRTRRIASEEEKQTELVLPNPSPFNL